jgi:hypothetical protein
VPAKVDPGAWTMTRYYDQLVTWIFGLGRYEFLFLIAILIATGIFCMRGLGLKKL